MDEEDFFEPHPDGTCIFCGASYWTPKRKRVAWSLLLLLGALCVGIWGGLQ